jgi:hypothetical protein
VLNVDFRKASCTPCPLRSRCTSSKSNARKLTLRPREQREALERARAEQATDRTIMGYCRDAQGRCAATAAAWPAECASDRARTRLPAAQGGGERVTLPYCYPLAYCKDCFQRKGGTSGIHVY